MLKYLKKLLVIILVFCSVPCFANNKSNIDLPTHNIYAVTGLGTINSDKFWGNVKIKSGYLNYDLYPFYFGGGLGFELGIANNNFPFHLKVNGTDTGNPIMLNFAPAAIGGVHYFFEKPEILAFFELGLGMNIRMLASSDIQHPGVGNGGPSFFTDFVLGAEWKFLRAAFDVQLDTELIYSIGGTIGAIFKLPSK